MQSHPRHVIAHLSPLVLLLHSAVAAVAANESCSCSCTGKDSLASTQALCPSVPKLHPHQINLRERFWLLCAQKPMPIQNCANRQPQKPLSRCSLQQHCPQGCPLSWSPAPFAQRLRNPCSCSCRQRRAPQSIALENLSVLLGYNCSGAKGAVDWYTCSGAKCKRHYRMVQRVRCASTDFLKGGSNARITEIYTILA